MGYVGWLVGGLGVGGQACFLRVQLVILLPSPSHKPFRNPKCLSYSWLEAGSPQAECQVWKKVASHFQEMVCYPCFLFLPSSSFFPPPLPLLPLPLVGTRLLLSSPFLFSESLSSEPLVTSLNLMFTIHILQMEKLRPGRRGVLPRSHSSSGQSQGYFRNHNCLTPNSVSVFMAQKL